MSKKKPQVSFWIGALNLSFTHASWLFDNWLSAILKCCHCFSLSLFFFSIVTFTLYHLSFVNIVKEEKLCNPEYLNKKEYFILTNIWQEGVFYTYSYNKYIKTWPLCFKPCNIGKYWEFVLKLRKLKNLFSCPSLFNWTW